MIIPGRFSSLAEARQSDRATVGYLRLFSEKGILLQARGGRGDHEAANAVSDTDFIREICAEGVPLPVAQPRRCRRRGLCNAK